MFVESLKFLCNSQVQGEEHNFIYTVLIWIMNKYSVLLLVENTNSLARSKNYVKITVNQLLFAKILFCDLKLKN